MAPLTPIAVRIRARVRESKNQQNHKGDGPENIDEQVGYLIDRPVFADAILLGNDQQDPKERPITKSDGAGLQKLFQGGL